MPGWVSLIAPYINTKMIPDHLREDNQKHEWQLQVDLGSLMQSPPARQGIEHVSAKMWFSLHKSHYIITKLENMTTRQWQNGITTNYICTSKISIKIIEYKHCMYTTCCFNNRIKAAKGHVYASWANKSSYHYQLQPASNSFLPEIFRCYFHVVVHKINCRTCHQAW